MNSTTITVEDLSWDNIDLIEEAIVIASPDLEEIRYLNTAALSWLGITDDMDENPIPLSSLFKFKALSHDLLGLDEAKELLARGSLITGLFTLKHLESEKLGRFVACLQRFADQSVVRISLYPEVRGPVGLEDHRDFRTIFDQQFQFMAVLDPNGIVLDMNDLPLRIQNARKKDYLGGPFWEGPAWKKSPEWQLRIKEQVLQACEHSAPIICNDKFWDGKGEEHHAIASYHAVRSRTGRVKFIIVQATDITELKESAQRAQYALSELAKRNEDLAHFVHITSHDLQEPVKIVQSCLDVLFGELQTTISAEAMVFLQIINDATTKMQRMIFALRNYAQIGDVQPKSDIDLVAMIQDVLHEQRTKRPLAKIHYKGPEEFIYSGFKQELYMMLEALIENATIYHQVHRVPEIIVDLKSLNDGVHLSIKDNGLGIDKKHQQKIFGIFQTLNSEVEHEGLGVGLALAKKIVEVHAGSIAVKSTPGQGSEFIVNLKNCNLNHE